MRKLRRNWMLLVGAAVLSAGLSAVAADPAAAASPDSTYSPGTAVAYKPVYSASKGGYDWHCAFKGWRSDAKVTWHCYLKEVYLDDGGWEYPTITTHSGSWTPSPPSYTTSTWLRKLQPEGELCVEAHALSVDGGVDSGLKCDA